MENINEIVLVNVGALVFVFAVGYSLKVYFLNTKGDVFERIIVAALVYVGTFHVLNNLSSLILDFIGGLLQ